MTDAQCRDWGESSLLPLYNPPSPSYYNLLHRRSLLELMHASLLLVLLCLSFRLPLNINSLSPLDHHLHPLNKHDPLIHSGPQLNWRRAPPCFLAAQTHPLLHHTASYPATQSMVCGQATLLAFQTQIYHGIIL